MRAANYYRWVFNPSNSEVTLSHNKEGHPAFIKTHGDLSREVNHPEAVHGYIFKIKGGWRLLDYAHKPIDDPYIKRRVMKAIAEKERVDE